MKNLAVNPVPNEVRVCRRRVFSIIFRYPQLCQSVLIICHPLQPSRTGSPQLCGMLPPRHGLLMRSKWSRHNLVWARLVVVATVVDLSEGAAVLRGPPHLQNQMDQYRCRAAPRLLHDRGRCKLKEVDRGKGPMREMTIVLLPVKQDRTQSSPLGPRVCHLHVLMFKTMPRIANPVCRSLVQL